MDPKRVAYIWSQELQDVADDLPANHGRSSMVHGLIQVLDLLERGQAQEAHQPGPNRSEEAHDDDDNTIDDSDDGEGSMGHPEVTIPRLAGKATVVQPELEFGIPGELKKYHDAKYVDFLMKSQDGYGELEDDSGSDTSCCSPQRKSKSSSHGLEYDCPSFPSMAKYATLIAASTSTACHLLAHDLADIAINWDGGRHHALRNRASGFCYVADIVLGIMRLVKYGRAKRKGRPKVMYLDLDIHYGDGVAQAFLSPTVYPASFDGIDARKPPRPPQVLTLSVHHLAPGFFPPPSRLARLPEDDTPNPFSLSIPLKAYPSSKTYSEIWESVEKVKEAFDPDYVVLQLGVDGLPGDKIGQYGAWTIDDQGGVKWCVEKVKQWGLPLCVLGGGGYDHPKTARAWAAATAVLVGRDLPPDTAIPDHEHFPEYGPSFTFEIPPSHARDENDDAYLFQVNTAMGLVADRIRHITAAHS